MWQPSLLHRCGSKGTLTSCSPLSLRSSDILPRPRPRRTGRLGRASQAPHRAGPLTGQGPSQRLRGCTGRPERSELSVGALRAAARKREGAWSRKWLCCCGDVACVHAAASSVAASGKSSRARTPRACTPTWAGKVAPRHVAVMCEAAPRGARLCWQAPAAQ